MKKAIVILFVVTSVIGGAAKFVYSEIESLKNELLQVKRVNTDLKTKNNNLMNKQKAIKQKLKDRRGKLAKKKLSRAKHKLGKAAVGVIPFIGTGAVAALTYTEIQGYCDDLKEYKEFEKSIFNSVDVNDGEEEKVLCGYNQEVIEKEVYKDLDEFKNDLSSIFVNQFNLFSNYIETEYNEFVKEEKR